MNAAFPGTPGNACDDNNPNTIDDRIGPDGCSCAGIVPTPDCDLVVDAGQDQIICEDEVIRLTAIQAGASDCGNSCCTRTVSNTDNCRNENNYVFFLANNQGNAHYEITNSSVVNWEECEDGTVRFTATNLRENDGTGELINLDFTYSGRTTVEPAEGHKEHNCSLDHTTEGWVYYTHLMGTFTSNQHGTFSVSRRGEAFQVGALSLIHI